MSRTLRAVVFDLGGVLIEWDPRRLYRQFFKGDEAGMETFLSTVEFNEWNKLQDAGRPFAEAVRDLSARFPQYADLIRVFPERWTETVGGVIGGTAALLEPLRAAGYELHALSNWSAETFPLVRDRYDFFRHFGTIVLSGEEKMIKPDPRLYRVLLERTGLEAQECLFIDDMPANVEAAKALGFETIRFESPEQLGRELKERGVLG